MSKKTEELLTRILSQLTTLNRQVADLTLVIKNLNDEVRSYVTSQTIGKTRGIDTL